MRYTVYADREMTQVAREINTTNPETVDAMHRLLRSANIYDPENLPLPFRFDLVGVIIHEL